MSEEKYPPLNLRLAGNMRRETSWILEGTEHDPNPVKMDFPSTYRIVPVSKVRVKDPATGKYKSGYATIRHITGCDSIDPKQQEADGYKPDPIFDNIYFVNGVLSIHREGSAIGTYDYLKKYQGNANNPDRPEEAEIEFEEVIAKDIAIQKTADFNVTLEAMGLLQPLRTRREDGRYDFNLDRLNQLAVLFNLDTEVSPEEQFADLVEIAKFSPERIVENAINPLKMLVLDIKKADRLEAIRFEPDRVFYTGEHKAVLMTFKGKLTKEKQIEQLAHFLAMPANQLHLDQLRVLIEAREQKTLEPVQ